MNKYLSKMRDLQSRPLSDSAQLGVDQIRTIESKLNCRLPSDYVEFLESYGCYSPDAYTYFRYLEPYPRGTRGMLDVFFGVDTKGVYDLVASYERYRDRMPAELRPIAGDPGGNVICLAVDGPEKGAVYFWDHENEETVSGGLKPGYSNVYLIGMSFDDFIASLELEEP